jgi:hypothetical protein
LGDAADNVRLCSIKDCVQCYAETAAHAGKQQCTEQVHNPLFQGLNEKSRSKQKKCSAIFGPIAGLHNSCSTKNSLRTGAVFGPPNFISLCNTALRLLAGPILKLQIITTGKNLIRTALSNEENERQNINR